MYAIQVPTDRRNIVTGGCLAAAAVALIALSLPALNGPLVLDSVKLHAIEPILSRHGDLAVLHTPSFGGDFGRIVSMASFVLNGQLSGGLSPFHLKLTNILLHITCGVLVFVLARLLVGAAGRVPGATLLAAATALLWLLSPVNFNVALYTIQRMAQLAALFTLAGLAFYAVGRLHPCRRVRWECLGLAGLVCLPLAVLSKQNGILLVPLAFLVEIYWLHPARPILTGRLLAVLGGTGAGAAAGLLLYLYPEALNYQSRDFSLGERLLSQPHALVSYIQHLLLPYGADAGVHTDDFAVSRSLLSPPSTLPSLLVIVAAVAFCGLGLRRDSRLRVPAFGTAFFLVGHALESTILPLELYFLHRNYLPGLGVYLAVAWLLTTGLPRRWVIPALSIYAVYFAAIDLARSLTWSDPDRLVATAVHYHPRSPRALSDYAQSALEKGRFDEALAANGRAVALVGSVNHRVQRLYILCSAGAPIPGGEYASLRELGRFGVRIELGQALGNLLRLYQRGGCPELAIEPLVAALDRIAARYARARGDPWTVLYYADTFLHASGRRDIAHRRLAKRLEAGHLSSGLYHVELFLEEGDRERAAEGLARLERRFPAARLQRYRETLDEFRLRLGELDEPRE